MDVCWYAGLGMVVYARRRRARCAAGLDDDGGRERGWAGRRTEHLGFLWLMEIHARTDDGSL